MKKRHIQALLLCGGLCLLSKGGWDLATYAVFQHHPEWFVRANENSIAASDRRMLLPVTLPSSNGLRPLADLHVLGRVEVQRLGMSVLVVEGDDDEKLGLAAGHLERSAALGQVGNAVIAGHRDTSFWPLREIEIGDRVRVRTAHTYEYVVTSVRIVSPEDVSVLQGSTDERTLTLVTCYPFRYFGSAPKRFIVRAVIPSA